MSEFAREALEHYANWVESYAPDAPVKEGSIRLALGESDPRSQQLPVDEIATAIRNADPNPPEPETDLISLLSDKHLK